MTACALLPPAPHPPPHPSGPLTNLFSHLDMGQGTRPFRSGGAGFRGAHAAQANTFWNLYSGDQATLPLPPCAYGPLLNFVGPFTGETASAVWAPAQVGEGVRVPSRLAAKRQACPPASSASAQHPAHAPLPGLTPPPPHPTPRSAPACRGLSSRPGVLQSRKICTQPSWR